MAQSALDLTAAPQQLIGRPASVAAVGVDLRADGAVLRQQFAALLVDCFRSRIVDTAGLLGPAPEHRRTAMSPGRLETDGDQLLGMTRRGGTQFEST